MTGNQVAYASVVVSQQVADETKRHNIATEDESKRHNKEEEALKTWSNEISQRALNIEESWKSTDNAIKAENNDIMRDYYKASLEEKEDYDRRLTNNEAQRIANDYWYKQESARISDELKDIERDKANETKRHDTETERLNSWANQIAEYGNSIKGKQLDYQARQWETENWLSFERYGLQLEELGLKRLIQQQTYELGLMSAENVGAQNLLRSRELDIKEQQFELSEKQFEQNKKESKSKIISNYAGILNQGALNSIRLMDLFSPF